MTRRLLIVAHGARAEASARAVEEAARGLGPLLGEFDAVLHAFLEFQPPGLAEGLDRAAEGAGEVVVLRCFLWPGRHADRDVPRAVEEARRRHPAVRFRLSPVLARDPGLLPLLAQTARRALEDPEP